MLPTEDKSSLFTSKRDDKLHYHFKGHTPNNIKSYQHLYFTSDEEIKEDDWYIDSSSDLTTVQQCKAKPSKALQEEINCRKIVATTDKSLKIKLNHFINNYDKKNVEILLPQIHQSFVEEYAKAEGIDEVLLECDWIGARCVLCGFDKDNNECINRADCPKKYFGGEEILKTDQNNCVIIHPVKSKLYTEEEVIQIIYNSSYVLSNGDTTKGHADNWIKENLK